MEVLKVYIIMQVGLHIAFVIGITCYAMWISVMAPMIRGLFP